MSPAAAGNLPVRTYVHGNLLITVNLLLLILSSPHLYKTVPLARSTVCLATAAQQQASHITTGDSEVASGTHGGRAAGPGVTVQFRQQRDTYDAEEPQGSREAYTLLNSYQPQAGSKESLRRLNGRINRDAAVDAWQPPEGGPAPRQHKRKATSFSLAKIIRSAATPFKALIHRRHYLVGVPVSYVLPPSACEAVTTYSEKQSCQMQFLEENEQPVSSKSHESLNSFPTLKRVYPALPREASVSETKAAALERKSLKENYLTLHVRDTRCCQREPSGEVSQGQSCPVTHKKATSLTAAGAGAQAPSVFLERRIFVLDGEHTKEFAVIKSRATSFPTDFRAVIRVRCQGALGGSGTEELRPGGGLFSVGGTTEWSFVPFSIAPTFGTSFTRAGLPVRVHCGLYAVKPRRDIETQPSYSGLRILPSKAITFVLGSRRFLKLMEDLTTRRWDGFRPPERQHGLAVGPKRWSVATIVPPDFSVDKDPVPLRGPWCRAGTVAQYTIDSCVSTTSESSNRRNCRASCVVAEANREHAPLTTFTYGYAPHVEDGKLVPTYLICAKNSYTTKDLSTCLFKRAGFGVVSKSQLPQNEGYPVRQWEKPITDCPGGTLPSSWHCATFPRGKGYVVATGLPVEPIEYDCQFSGRRISHDRLFNMNSCHWLPPMVKTLSASELSSSSASPQPCASPTTFSPQTGSGGDCLPVLMFSVDDTGTHIKYYEARPFTVNTPTGEISCTPYSRECSPHGMSMDMHSFTLFPQEPSQRTPGFFLPAGYDAQPHGLPVCPLGYDCETNQESWVAPNPFIPLPFSLSATKPVRAYVGLTGRQTSNLMTQPFSADAHRTDLLLYLPGQEFLQHCPHGYRCAGSIRDALVEPLPAGTFRGRRMASGSLPSTCLPGHYCPAAAVFQTPCPRGEFSSASGQTACRVAAAGRASPSLGSSMDVRCPAGHYCPVGTKQLYAKACPEHTINEQLGAADESACLPCPKGYTCGKGTGGLRRPGYCPIGHYCPGDRKPPQPCPAGTYSPLHIPSPLMKREEDCLPCPSGFSCREGSSANSLQSGRACAPGTFCPPGTGAEPVLCPFGTYGLASGAVSASDCLPCPQGEFCAVSLSTHTKQLTMQRGKCPPGSLSINTGLHGDARKLWASEWGRKPGMQVVAATRSSSVCWTTDEDLSAFQSVRYADRTGFEASPVEQMTAANNLFWIIAENGNLFISVDNLQTFDLVSAGRHHTFAAYHDGALWAGFAEAGVFVSRDYGRTFTPAYTAKGVAAVSFSASPDSAHILVGEAGGSLLITKDKFKTINRVSLGRDPVIGAVFFNGGEVVLAAVGVSVYRSDDAGGKFAKSFDFQNLIRHLRKSRTGDVFACLVTGRCFLSKDQGKTFRILQPPLSSSGVLDLHILSNSTLVVAGEDRFVATEDYNTWREYGINNQACNRGIHRFLLLESVVPPPVEGTFGQCIDETGTRMVKASAGGGTPCEPGTWREPSADGQCLPCPAGHYCPLADTLTGVTKEPCKPGLLCPSGLAGPPSLASHPCPRGHYCPTATETAIACREGTYNPLLHQGGDHACLEAPPGYYVKGVGATEPTGPCPVHHYCPLGSIRPIPCQEGKARPEPGGAAKEDCFACPEGYFCPNNQDPVAPKPCPPGHYCPRGTVQPAPCPRGTYNPGTLLPSAESCLRCPAGKYCATEGLTSVTGDCNAGYLCLEGAMEPSPVDGTTGILCLSGVYCPAGTHRTYSCPPGKYLPTRGAADASACVNCPAGSYCLGSGLASPDGLCPAGYICPEGTAEPTRSMTPAGTMAAAGSAASTDCPPGTYAPERGMSECWSCPAGYLCPNARTTSPTRCPAGHYCPPRSSQSIPCPVGTIATNLTPRYSIDQCVPCPPGQYCQSAGATSESGPCSGGYYCVLGAVSPTPTGSSGGSSEQGGKCPPGAYCPAGAHLPTWCPRGTYQPLEQQTTAGACQQCLAGHYCPHKGMAAPTPCEEGTYCPAGGDGYTVRPCSKGHYCLAGSAAQIQCPRGTYQDKKLQAECIYCPPGLYCNAPGLLTGEVCPDGHFCPKGSIGGTTCRPGTYNPQLGRRDNLECFPCPPGYTCNTYGLSAPTGPCPAGKWCEEGATLTSGHNNCTPGHYCPAGSATPRPCLAGSYCATSNLEAPTGKCDAGYYCLPGATNKNEHPCLPGAYCPQGSSTYILCPIGTYSAAPQATSQAVCKTCPVGKYCGAPGLIAPSGDCRGGFVCDAGSIVPNPSTGICSPGHKCPAGSHAPVPCGDNMWQPLPMQESCQPCPAGFICTQSSTTVCKKGHYCDGASTKKCPVGTYQPLDGQGSRTSCLTCKPGFECKEEALVTPTDRCPAGKYCTGDATRDCPQGHYCPQGSAVPIPCPPGSYCAAAGLSTPSGLCDGGHICFHASTTEGPTGHVELNACYSTLTGGDCPAGFFCPPGAMFPLMCPPGTFKRDTGGATEASCAACEAGKHCGGWGLEAAVGGCTAGYYCPKGQKTGSNLACPAGNECPEDASVPSPCAEGTYQATEGQRTCLPCPEGYVCPAKSVVPQPCPAGHYCVNGQRIACPAGTYTPFEGSWKEEHCLKCPPGKFCPTAGASNLTSAAECTAGHYCRFGAEAAPPQKPSTNCGDANDSCVPGRRCPSGFYCPAGSSAPVLCPPGTSGSPEGSDDTSDCLQCPAGHYCGRDDAAALPCDPGFLCPAGSPVGRPTASGAICPQEHFCPAGATTPTACEVGKFSDVEGLGTCKTCPAGFLCAAGALPEASTACSEGHYCSAGVSTSVACPQGTYMPTQYGTEESACLPCPPGAFCNTEGAIASTGTCDGGYYCLSGAVEQQPAAAADGISYGKCPAGYFCTAGSPLPGPCPPGTYNENEGAADESSCSKCPAGSFCGSYGSSEPQGSCAVGFHCIGGATTSKPTDGVTGAICAEGHYCSNGTSSPCPEHTYLDQRGGGICKACPEGHFCVAGSTTPQRCPPTFYCAFGRGKRPCPTGTYSDAYGLSSASQCLECPPSKYCDNGQILGSCAAGYICVLGIGPSDKPTGVEPSGSTGATDLGVQLGSLCPAGSYCPVGALMPSHCPPGETTPDEGATSSSACTTCMEGFYCPVTDTAASPCPRGYFCPARSREPRACPLATFSSKTHARSESDCEPCTAGFLCPEGTVRPRRLCPYGYYCGERSIQGTPCPVGTYGRGAGGADEATACAKCAAGFTCAGGGEPRQPCPPGYYCPRGSTSPLGCPPGQFCPGQTVTPIDCPPGYYCPAKSAEPVPCTPGHFCVGNSATASACPFGTHARPRKDCENMPTEAGCCAPCPAGTYSDVQGAEECQPCAPGFVCTGGATTARPTSPREGYICPKGHYCPAGTTQPLPCPAGKINAEEGGGELDSCLKCASGTYSDKEAQTACSLCGGTSTTQPGDTTCTCDGKNRSFQKLDGTCLCKPFFEAYSLTEVASSGGSRVLAADVDASADCQPIVQDNCTTDIHFDHPRLLGTSGTQSVRLQDGTCMTAADCAHKCGSKGGRLLAEVGSCECYELAKRVPGCDAECMASIKSVHLKDDKLVFATSSTSVESSATLEDIAASGVLRGTLECDDDTKQNRCAIAFHVVDETGVYGLFGPTTDFESEILAVRPSTRAAVHHRVPYASMSFRKSPSIFACWMNTGLCPISSYARRHAQNIRVPADSSAPAASEKQKRISEFIPSVKSPTQCLHRGDSVIWILQQGAYPVYVRNSLLNTISDFDATPFRTLAATVKLENEMKTSGTPFLKYFGYTFTEAGQFVFGTSADTDSHAIFRVMEEDATCATAAARGLPLQTDAQAFSAAGVKLQTEVLTHPSFTNVGITVGGCFLILLLLVFILARIRAANERTKQGAERSSVRALQRAERKGNHHRLSQTVGSSSVRFGMQCLTYEKQKEVEAFLSHIVESDSEVDKAARVTKMDAEELEAACLSNVSPDAPIDLALFQCSFRRLAQMHAILKQYFASRSAGVLALHAKELESRSTIEKALAPIIGRVERVLQDRLELQESLVAMCKECEKFVDDLRAPRVVFAVTAEEEAAATEGGGAGGMAAVFQPYCLPEELLKSVRGSMACLAFLAQNASEVLLVLRGAGSGVKGSQASRVPITMRVAAQYAEAVNGELQMLQQELKTATEKQPEAQEPDTRVKASAAAVPARLAAHGRLRASLQAFALKLEEILATREKIRRGRRELLQKRYLEAEVRARLCDKNDAELVTLIVQVVEKLLGNPERRETGRSTVSSRKQMRDAVVSVVLPIESSFQEEQARSTLTVEKTFSHFENRCLSCLEDIERTVESHRATEVNGITKEENLKKRELQARQQLDFILMDQQQTYLEVERTERITRFFRNLEESKVMQLREELKQHFFTLKQKREEEAMTDAELQEERNTSFQKFEGRIKALREQLNAERDSTLIAITDLLSEHHEQRVATVTEMHQAELDHLQQKFNTLRDLTNCAFTHMKERLQRKIEARRDRFKMLATEVVDLYNKIVAKAFRTRNHFVDAVTEVMEQLSNLASAQESQEEKVQDEQQVTLSERKEKGAEALHLYAETLRGTIDKLLALSIKLNEELLGLEEEKMLSRCLAASDAAVDAAFDTRRKKLLKRMEVLAEADGGEEDSVDHLANERRAEARLKDAKRAKELEEITKLHLKEKELQAAAVREKFAHIKEERALTFDAMLQNQREALGICIENLEILKQQPPQIYGVQLPSDAGFSGELAAPAEELKRLLRALDRISCFFKRVHQYAGGGRDRTQRSKDLLESVIASWPAFAEQIVRDAEEDRKNKRETENKILRQQRRGHKKVSTRIYEADADDYEALGDKEVSVSNLLRQVDEKRQAGWTATTLLDHSVLSAYGGSPGSTHMETSSEHMSKECDDALRKVEATFKRGAARLRAEYDADMEGIKLELAEALASVERQAEMDRSRVEVEMNLKAACAETDEERLAVEREMRRLLKQINEETLQEKASLEAAAQEKMSARTQRFHQQRAQLEEEADAEERRARQVIQRRIAARKKEEQESIIEACIQEARAHTNAANIKRLHEAVVAPLNETLNAMVAEQLEEKARRLNDITATMRQAYEEDLAAVEAEFDGKIRDLERRQRAEMKTEGAVDSAEIRAQLDALRVEREHALHEKESTFSIKLEHALQVERVAIEPSQADELIRKQEESADQVMKVLQEFVAIGDQTAISLVAQARQAKKNLEGERQKVREAAGTRLLEIHRVMKEKEEELRRKFALALDAHRKNLELQREREEAQFQQAHQEEMARRRELQRERQQRQLRFLASKNRDPERQEALFQQHKEEARQYEEALQRDRARQLVARQQRLQMKAARRGLSGTEAAEQEQLEKERARLAETEQLAAKPEKEAKTGGADAVDTAEEENLCKLMFALAIEFEASTRATRLHSLLTEILQKLQRGDTILEDDASSSHTAEELGLVFQKVEMLMEAIKNQESATGA